MVFQTTAAPMHGAAVFSSEFFTLMVQEDCKVWGLVHFSAS